MVDFQYGAQLYELIVGGGSGKHQLIFDKLKKQLIQRKLESEDEIKHLFYLLRDGLYHAKKCFRSYPPNCRHMIWTAM